MTFMSTTSRLAVLAGSFDPLTNGHVDLIERSTRLFDRVVVAVLANSAKQPLFTANERVDMIRNVVAAHANVEVDAFDGLLADYVQRRGAAAVVRGLRTATEFSDEWQMALMNRQLNPACETVFLIPAAVTAHISSRLVREIASLGGSVDGLVPPSIASRLAARVRRA